MPGFSRISPSIRDRDVSDKCTLIPATVGEPGIAPVRKNASLIGPQDGLHRKWWYLPILLMNLASGLFVLAKKFPSRIFFASKFFVPEIFSIENFLSGFFCVKYFCAAKFLGKEVFLSEKFPGPGRVFMTVTHFYKSLFHLIKPENFRVQNFLWPEFF